MNNELIKRIDEERYAYRLYGFDGSSTDLVLADCKAEIERLSKPYVPMTRPELDRIWSINSSLLSLQDEFIKRAGLEVKCD